MCEDTRIKRAIDYHKAGCNCAQAVACNYCDLVGISRSDMYKMVEGLGRGMGGYEGTCGAVSAICILVGLSTSDGSFTVPGKTKDMSYDLSREALRLFKDKNGSVKCRDLKGIDTSVVLRDCDGCIEDACEIVESVVFPEVFGK